MKIEINIGGFGIASLFSKESTKAVLIQQSRATLLSGSFLDELGIIYKVGDEIELREPTSSGNAQFICHIKVYSIEGDIYNCELITQ